MLPAAKAMNILPAHAYKYVNTGLFSSSFVATSVVIFKMPVLVFNFQFKLL